MAVAKGLWCSHRRSEELFRGLREKISEALKLTEQVSLLARELLLVG
jgi:hypothetical protein